MKKCKKCLKVKNSFDFYKDKSRKDFLRYICKECDSLCSRNKYLKLNKNARLNKKVILEEGKTYYDYWYSENKKKVNTRNKEWRYSNPLRTNAHYIVRKNIRNGSITKPILCMCCSLEKRLEAHHEDYNYPLKIVWLCRKCHRKYHDGYDISFKNTISKIFENI